jgi:hypothetical protein
MHQLLEKFAVLCAVTMLCGSSLAQVVKCKDAKGKVVYSDVACPANFNVSSVNLSGANVTESQVSAAQDKAASNRNYVATAQSFSPKSNHSKQHYSGCLD